MFDTVTTGAANDIEQATNLARSMVTRFGMSKKFGLIGLESVESQYLEGRSVLNCSDVTAAEIDQEVMKILKECYEEALSLLSANREVMDKLAAFLIEKETITGKEFMRIYREIKGLPEPLEGENPEGTQRVSEKKTTAGAAAQQSVSAGQSAAAGTQADAPAAGQGVNAGQSTAAETQANAPAAQQSMSGDGAALEPKPAAPEPGKEPGVSASPEADAAPEQKKPWTPPTPGPEAQDRGPVGRFSGAPLKDDETR